MEDLLLLLRLVAQTPNVVEHIGVVGTHTAFGWEAVMVRTNMMMMMVVRIGQLAASTAVASSGTICVHDVARIGTVRAQNLQLVLGNIQGGHVRPGAGRVVVDVGNCRHSKIGLALRLDQAVLHLQQLRWVVMNRMVATWVGRIAATLPTGLQVR